MTTVIPAGQRTRNAELVRDLYGTLRRERRLEQTDRFFHADCVDHDPADWRTSDDAFPRLRAGIDHLVAGNDRAMLIAAWTGTLTWSGGGPSGPPLEMRTCDRFRSERGMVAEHGQAADHLALGRAGLPTP